MLIYFVALSEILSLCILYKIWKGRDPLILKFLLSFVTLIPFLGPIFYLVGADSTPRTKNQLNAGGRLFGRGRYTEWWGNEKPRMEQKIKELENEIKEKEATNNKIEDDQ